MKTFTVHQPKNWPTLKIIGETIQEAVEANIRTLASNNHGQRDTELCSLEYKPGILGGKGGWEAKFIFFDLVTNAYGESSAWIYADEDGNPPSEAGKNNKTETIRLRITQEEKAAIQKLADRYTGGNMSKLIISALTEKYPTV